MFKSIPANEFKEILPNSIQDFEITNVIQTSEDVFEARYFSANRGWVKGRIHLLIELDALPHEERFTAFVNNKHKKFDNIADFESIVLELLA